MTRPSLPAAAGVPDVAIARWGGGVRERWVVYAANEDGLVVSLRPDGTIERGSGDVLQRAGTIEPAWAGALAIALLRADAERRRLQLLLHLVLGLSCIGAGIALSWALAL